MSNEQSTSGPLRHFRLDRRGVLQSLVTGAGVAALAPRVMAASPHAHAHAVASTALDAAPAAERGAASLRFLDAHAFDTLALLGEQIVPGSRAARVPEFLDRLLEVESLETQKRFTQALGAFEREARAAHGRPWKALAAPEANALLAKISTQPDTEASRTAFDAIKGAVAETYYSSETGMKELGWDGSVTFAPPGICG